MTVTCHSNTLQSSTKPAENPSIGFLESSARVRDAFASVSRARAPKQTRDTAASDRSKSHRSRRRRVARRARIRVARVASRAAHL
jgi:hypothetical protein